MVGGGIFSTLGVVIQIAGSWAWVSFFMAGLIALMSGYACAKLADHYGEGGGAFTFLRRMNAKRFAGSLSWILIVGYVLTNAVYAYTFGEYLGYIAGLGPWFPRLAAVVILAIFVVVNLRGAGEAGTIEIVLVWFKLFVLLGLAAFGLAQWQPSMLSQGVPESGAGTALLGAASVFMAYEGFQLLTYDYEDIRQPNKILSRAILSAIVVVTITYVLVAIGTAMLIGADEIVLNKEVSLAVAGRQALGIPGLIIVTIAAAFSTGSALNATLFATARLSHLVARGGELPVTLDHRNAAGAPDRAVLALGILAAILAVMGKLSTLVEAASLSFLFTFAVVSGLAFKLKAGHRLITGIGAVGAAGATLALIVWLAQEDLAALLFLLILVLTAVFARPKILGLFKVKTLADKDD